MNDAFPHPVIIDTLTSTQRSKANRLARRKAQREAYQKEVEAAKSLGIKAQPFKVALPPIPMVTIWYENAWVTMPAVAYASNPRYSRHFRRAGGRI